MIIRAREIINIITQVGVHEHVCTYFLLAQNSLQDYLYYIYKCSNANSLRRSLYNYNLIIRSEG